MKRAQEAVAWLKSFSTFGIKPGLERMEYMLERLENPQRRLKFVHIAGTNGKGSTAAFLHSVLRKAGYQVGMFISPQITTYLDRITYNGEEISEGALIEICERLLPLTEELKHTEIGSPTEFELLTTIAIVYFAKYSFPDIVLWETGMGGRLDSTNVVNPLLSIITSVAMDHMEILGETPEAIAREKAGIIKSGVPVVTGVEEEETLALLQEIAHGKRTKVYRWNKEFYITKANLNHEKQTFGFQGPFRGYDQLEITLRGIHQFKNAAVSVMALELLRQYYAFLIEEETLLEGLVEAHIPGRLDLVQAQPRIVLDGAHNVDGIQAICESLPRMYDYRRLIVVLSIMQEKQVDEMLHYLLPMTDAVVLTKANNPRAMEPSVLFEKIKNKIQNFSIYIEQEPLEAVQKAAFLANKDDLILVTGSLYLVENIHLALPRLLEVKVGDPF